MIKRHIFQGSFKNILDKGSYSFFISLWVSAAFFFLRGVSNRCQQSQEPISSRNGAKIHLLLLWLSMKINDGHFINLYKLPL